MTKQEAIAKFLECEVDDLREEGNFYGLDVFDGYAVATDDEADQACKENIKDSVWAFNASFILDECGLDFSGEDSLKAMQEKSCESANDFILSLIEKTCGLDSFVEAAISADGRGHFLSSYDGQEVELEGGFFAYRID